MFRTTPRVPALQKENAYDIRRQWILQKKKRGNMGKSRSGGDREKKTRKELFHLQSAHYVGDGQGGNYCNLKKGTAGGKWGRRKRRQGNWLEERTDPDSRRAFTKVITVQGKVLGGRGRTRNKNGWVGYHETAPTERIWNLKNLGEEEFGRLQRGKGGGEKTERKEVLQIKKNLRLTYRKRRDGEELPRRKEKPVNVGIRGELRGDLAASETAKTSEPASLKKADDQVQ